jgi:predicted  nucleic acid-binding Zn-ribbon protein
MMSEPSTCITCGQTYGASWGDVSAECWDCRNGNTPQKMKEEIKKLKERIKELESKDD